MNGQCHRPCTAASQVVEKGKVDLSEGLLSKCRVNGVEKLVQTRKCE